MDDKKDSKPISWVELEEEAEDEAEEEEVESAAVAQEGAASSVDAAATAQQLERLSQLYQRPVEPETSGIAMMKLINSRLNLLKRKPDESDNTGPKEKVVRDKNKGQTATNNGAFITNLATLANRFAECSLTLDELRRVLASEDNDLEKADQTLRERLTLEGRLVPPMQPQATAQTNAPEQQQPKKAGVRKKPPKKAKPPPTATSQQSSSSKTTAKETTDAIPGEFVTEEEKETCELVLKIFPEVDPRYVIERIVQHGEELHTIVNRMSDNSNYPKLKDREAAERQQQRRQQFLDPAQFEMDEFLRHFPDPEEHFVDATRPVTTLYTEHATVYLMNRFPAMRPEFLTRQLEENNNHLVPTLRSILDGMGGRDAGGCRRKARNYQMPQFMPEEREPVAWPQEVDEQFFRELQFIENEAQIRELLAQRATERERRIEELEAVGGMLECQCCCGECLPEDMIQCTNAHSFCHKCVTQHADTIIGQGGEAVGCLMPDCESEYSLAQLQALVRPCIFNIFLRLKQQQELRDAGLQNMESCPFCDFAMVIDYSQEKIFTCLNPNCRRESCRQCRQPNHIPRRCAEVEQDADVRMRTYVENAMADALIRTCPQCNKRLVKSGGCNHLHCPCGAGICYVCRQLLPDRDPYSHFGHPTGYHFYGRRTADPSAESNRPCPMDTTIDQVHADVAERAGNEARERFLKENPELQVKKEVKEEEVKQLVDRGRGGRHHYDDDEEEEYYMMLMRQQMRYAEEEEDNAMAYYEMERERQRERQREMQERELEGMTRLGERMQEAARLATYRQHNPPLFERRHRPQPHHRRVARVPPPRQPPLAPPMPPRYYTHPVAEYEREQEQQRNFRQLHDRTMAGYRELMNLERNHRAELQNESNRELAERLFEIEGRQFEIENQLEAWGGIEALVGILEGRQAVEEQLTLFLEEIQELLELVPAHLASIAPKPEIAKELAPVSKPWSLAAPVPTDSRSRVAKLDELNVHKAKIASVNQAVSATQQKMAKKNGNDRQRKYMRTIRALLQERDATIRARDQLEDALLREGLTETELGRDDKFKLEDAEIEGAAKEAQANAAQRDKNEQTELMREKLGEYADPLIDVGPELPQAYTFRQPRMVHRSVRDQQQQASPAHTEFNALRRLHQQMTGPPMAYAPAHHAPGNPRLAFDDYPNPYLGELRGHNRDIQLEEQLTAQRAALGRVQDGHVRDRQREQVQSNHIEQQIIQLQDHLRVLEENRRREEEGRQQQVLAHQNRIAELERQRELRRQPATSGAEPPNLDLIAFGDSDMYEVQQAKPNNQPAPMPPNYEEFFAQHSTAPSSPQVSDHEQSPVPSPVFGYNRQATPNVRPPVFEEQVFNAVAEIMPHATRDHVRDVMTWAVRATDPPDLHGAVERVVNTLLNCHTPQTHPIAHMDMTNQTVAQTSDASADVIGKIHAAVKEEVPDATRQQVIALMLEMRENGAGTRRKQDEIVRLLVNQLSPKDDFTVKPVCSVTPSQRQDNDEKSIRQLLMEAQNQTSDATSLAGNSQNIPSSSADNSARGQVEITFNPPQQEPKLGAQNSTAASGTDSSSRAAVSSVNLAEKNRENQGNRVVRQSSEPAGIHISIHLGQQNANLQDQNGAEPTLEQ